MWHISSIRERWINRQSYRKWRGKKNQAWNITVSCDAFNRTINQSYVTQGNGDIKLTVKFCVNFQGGNHNMKNTLSQNLVSCDRKWCGGKNKRFFNLHCVTLCNMGRNINGLLISSFYVLTIINWIHRTLCTKLQLPSYMTVNITVAS